MLAASLYGSAQAQAPTAADAAKTIPRIGALILSVTDLEKSVAFYTALGLQRTDAAAALPASVPLDPTLAQLTNLKGASLRSATFKIPGVEFVLRLNEFGNVARNATHSRMQDPGAARFAISVYDLDALIATLKKLGGTVMSKDGVGIRFRGENDTGPGLYAANIRDPDGFMIEAMQYSPYREHARFVVTVSEMFNAMRFYTESFRLVIDPPFWDPTIKVVDLFWDPDPRVMDLLDTPNAPSRYIFMRYRRTADWFELMEFKNIARQPFRPALSDPGAVAVSLVVSDVNAVVKSVKASRGGTVVSAGGEAVKGPRGAAAFVRDPDGFYLEVLQGS
jgi:catechol 2,3-dioxygenase-like lactoylglutathione lyase family enzyme